MPGYLQVAQPVTFGHHLLAWNEMLARDDSRLADCAYQLNYCPLGSAPRGVIRHRRMTAKASALWRQPKIIGLSIRQRLCHRIYVRRSDHHDAPLAHGRRDDYLDECAVRFCRSPRSVLYRLIDHAKENPDVPELIRGKAGRVQGHLVALITLMKGQPLAQQRQPGR